MIGAFGSMGTVMIAGVPGGLTVTLSGLIGMINLNMMVKLLLAIAVLVLLLRFNLTDNLLRRNLKQGPRRLITLGGIIAVILLLISALGSLRSRGEGSFFTDMTSHGSELLTGDDEAGGETLEISIRGSVVTIGGRTYDDAGDLTQIINEAASSGAGLVLIDDYADRQAYEAVLDVITGAGIDDEKIERRESTLNETY